MVLDLADHDGCTNLVAAKTYVVKEDFSIWEVLSPPSRRSSIGQHTSFLFGNTCDENHYTIFTDKRSANLEAEAMQLQQRKVKLDEFFNIKPVKMHPSSSSTAFTAAAASLGAKMKAQAKAGARMACGSQYNDLTCEEGFKTQSVLAQKKANAEQKLQDLIQCYMGLKDTVKFPKTNCAAKLAKANLALRGVRKKVDEVAWPWVASHVAPFSGSLEGGTQLLGAAAKAAGQGLGL
eukprot:gnl/MRDRNA2_/MRDRNA2_45400_c0_seq1.p1 gnl/MRDRNA2_/MRDRNA2_45400_c0~~gnl/MRDRNA2_/MRDRNA2_45400_c0_seq1.p1  ORF type:complete len:235 (+),score=55.77 gnl/MRDRNA2_/MRDRNA2_45400_c0_seq1:79-783(+)